jgi:hypothetical protein
MCFWFSPKWVEWPHPKLVHWWLLVHSSRWRVLVEFGPHSHNGHLVEGGLDWWVLVPFDPFILPSLDRLAGALVQEAP